MAGHDQQLEELLSSDTMGPHDPIKDALAWFIQNDDTNWGGDYWERRNAGYIQPLRLSMEVFGSHSEIAEGAKRHEARLKGRHWPEEFQEKFPDVTTDAEIKRMAANIRELSQIPPVQED